MRDIRPYFHPEHNLNVKWICMKELDQILISSIKIETVQTAQRQ